MERPAGPLFPLAKARVADAVEGEERLGAEQMLRRWACRVGVPDRPAESFLQSLITRVHREHHGQSVVEPVREAGVCGFDREPAMVAKRDGLRWGHDVAPSRVMNCTRARRVVGGSRPRRVRGRRRLRG